MMKSNIFTIIEKYKKEIKNSNILDILEPHLEYLFDFFNKPNAKDSVILIFEQTKIKSNVLNVINKKLANISDHEIVINDKIVFDIFMFFIIKTIFDLNDVDEFDFLDLLLEDNLYKSIEENYYYIDTETATTIYINIIYQIHELLKEIEDDINEYLKILIVNLNKIKNVYKDYYVIGLPLSYKYNTLTYLILVFKEIKND